MIINNNILNKNYGLTNVEGELVSKKLGQWYYWQTTKLVIVQTSTITNLIVVVLV